RISVALRTRPSRMAPVRCRPKYFTSIPTSGRTRVTAPVPPGSRISCKVSSNRRPTPNRTSPAEHSLRSTTSATRAASILLGADVVAIEVEDIEGEEGEAIRAAAADRQQQVVEMGDAPVVGCGDLAVDDERATDLGEPPDGVGKEVAAVIAVTGQETDAAVPV